MDSLCFDRVANDRVHLTSPTTGATFTVPRRCYDNFVSEGDVLLPIYHGGTWIVVVKGGAVAAVVPARTDRSPIRLEDLLQRGLLPRLDSEA